MASLERNDIEKRTLMNHFFRLIIVAAVIVLFSGTPSAIAQLSPEETRRIEEAAPAKSTVKPRQPRLLLVFSLSEGYQHTAIPRVRTAFDILGKKTGAFETVHSEDLSVFKPENLRRFDAICLNNTTQLKFEDQELRRSLLDFVAGGKGIIGIHAATDNFPSWPEGQELLGRCF